MTAVRGRGAELASKLKNGKRKNSMEITRSPMKASSKG